MWYRAFIIAFVLASFLTINTASATPPRPVKKQDALKQVQKSLQEERTKATRLSKTGKNLKKEIKKLKQNIVSTAKKVQNSEAKLTNIRAELAQLKAREKHYTDLINENQEALSELIMASERLSRLPKEALIARPGAPIDAARSAILLKHALPSIQEQTEYLLSMIQNLEDVQNRVADRLKKQAQAQTSLEKQHRNLANLITKRRTLYKKTTSEEKETKKHLKALTERAANLEELIKNIEKNKKYGDLANLDSAVMPVSGKTIYRFGQKNDLGTKNKGLTIAASPGAIVVTPMNGTVRFAGAFQGYKQILIVEHGGGYHSLIAGLAETTVDVGDKIKAGEPVGRLKRSGANIQLYYELRLKGKPINPKPVLVAQKVKG